MGFASLGLPCLVCVQRVLGSGYGVAGGGRPVREGPGRRVRRPGGSMHAARVLSPEGPRKERFEQAHCVSPSEPVSCAELLSSPTPSSSGLSLGGSLLPPSLWVPVDLRAASLLPGIRAPCQSVSSLEACSGSDPDAALPANQLEKAGSHAASDLIE